EGAPPAAQKKWHLKLGIAAFFLGHLGEAVQHLQQAEGAVAHFYLGRALSSRGEYEEALKAFDKAEKSGYTAGEVNLQRAGIHRQRGDLTHARQLLHRLEELSTHSAEYHFQLASAFLSEGERLN